MRQFWIALACLISALSAYAHDYKRPDLDGWYGSLMRPHVGGGFGGGTSCCSKEDCHTTEAELRDGQWWARLGHPVNNAAGERDWVLEDWIKIPDEVIVRGSNGNAIINQAGEAVICHPVIWKDASHLDTKTEVVYCFVPPDQS